MRRFLISCVLVLSAALPASAQEWTEYRNVEDGFHALFPGQPAITSTTWKSQAGFLLPERVYAVDKGRERYLIRVIDYRNVEQLGAERARTCPAGAEPCLGNANLAGVGYWKHDVRGAPAYALLSYLATGARVTDMFWNQLDLVAGVMFQLTNTDQSRTYAYIAMHEMRLYITEARVPGGSPSPRSSRRPSDGSTKTGVTSGISACTTMKFTVFVKLRFPAMAGAGAAGNNDNPSFLMQRRALWLPPIGRGVDFWDRSAQASPLASSRC